MPSSPPLLPLSLSTFCRSTTHTPSQPHLSLSASLNHTPLPHFPSPFTPQASEQKRSLGKTNKPKGLTIFNHAQIALLPLQNLLQIEQVLAQLLDFPRIKLPRVGRCLGAVVWSSFAIPNSFLFFSFLFFLSFSQHNKANMTSCLCVWRSIDRDVDMDG